MKKILVGFLVPACLLLSFTARLPLFNEASLDKPHPTYYAHKQNSLADTKSFISLAKFSNKGKRVQRLFHASSGHPVSGPEKTTLNWNFIGLLAGFALLIHPVYLFSASLRAPPAKLCI